MPAGTRGRIVLSAVHPEFGASGAQAVDQDDFLNALLNHAAGAGDAAHATIGKDIFVYVGEKHSTDYLQHLQGALARASGSPERVHLIDRADLWRAAIARDPTRAIAVVPGGTVLAKMSPGGATAADPGLRAEIAAVQHAVRQGAGYLGICAGAFIGAQWANVTQPDVRTAAEPSSFLALTPDVAATGWASAGGQMARAALIGVRVGTQTYRMPLFNGPMLAVQDGSRILAHFDDTRVANAAMSRPDSKGRSLRPAAVTVTDPRGA